MRTIRCVVVHCTATPQTATVASLTRHFRQLGWRRPGYHWVVLPDGRLVRLLDEDVPANGVKGHNAESVHVAYVGGTDERGRAVDNRTPRQKQALVTLLRLLKGRYPGAVVAGHRDLSPDLDGNGRIDPWERVKECPCFDAKDEYARLKGHA